MTVHNLFDNQLKFQMESHRLKSEHENMLIMMNQKITENSDIKVNLQEQDNKVQMLMKEMQHLNMTMKI